jgi:hypothetical protein
MGFLDDRDNAQQQWRGAPNSRCIYICELQNVLHFIAFAHRGYLHSRNFQRAVWGSLTNGGRISEIRRALTKLRAQSAVPDIEKLPRNTESLASGAVYARARNARLVNTSGGEGASAVTILR